MRSEAVRNRDNMWLDSVGDTQQQKIISKYDNALLRYLFRLKKTMDQQQMDLREVGSIIDSLASFRSTQKQDYLSALVRPEITKGAKIPSQIPVPSSSFQLHSSYLITTNSSGNAAVCFNPFYLNSTNTNSSFFVNNNAGLSGQSSSNFFTSTNILQNIPAVYSRYRVVSASMTIKYIGRLDIVQGVIGGAILYETNVTNQAYGTVEADLARYGDFNIAQDAFYYQEHMTLDGIRLLYFPIDNSYEQYYDLNTEKPGFLMYAYIYGGVPAAAAYKVDIYVNYECLPDPAFLNYIPVSQAKYTGSCEETKREAVKSVQDKPITNESAAKGAGGETSTWDNITSAIGPLVPGMMDIASEIIPGAKLVKGAYDMLTNL